MMTQLYSKYAGIYHDMYQHVFDYDQEFGFYDQILKKHGCHSILEIGCGSGMLARRFIANGYNYIGLDLFDEMLDIARKEVPEGKFIRCDMRNIDFKKQFDAVLITGRSLAYVVENKGIINTFSGIRKAMNDNGLLVFGVFEANGIFDNFNSFEQDIQHGNRRIKRISRMEMNLETGWTYNWHARYIVEENGIKSEFEDITTLRAFTGDEITLFLKLTGFKVTETIDEPKTITFLAQKS
jgi:SAM-dependent methyltransferase